MLPDHCAAGSAVTKHNAFKLTTYHDHPIVNVTRMNYFLFVFLLLTFLRKFRLYCNKKLIEIKISDSVPLSVKEES